MNKYKQQLKTAIEFAERRGVKTKLDSGLKAGHFYYDRDLNQIEISTSGNDENKLYGYLHELGHWRCDSIQGMNFAKLQETYSNNSKTYKIAILEEEIAAWNAGKDIAENIGIEINSKKFETFKTQCLMTYIRWIQQ